MKKLNCVFAVLAALLSYTLAELDLNKVNPNDFQQYLPPEFANPNEALNKFKNMVKDKCIKVSGEDKGTKAFDSVESGVMELTECTSSILNFTAIQKEMDIAIPNGELDEVFNKYCRKRPEALKCFDDFNEKLLPCLDADERDYQAVIMRIVYSIINFVCYKDGDRIALFVAEKGPECLESKRNEIQQCVNSTFSQYIPKGNIENVNELPKFTIGEKQCEEMHKLENCVVGKLEDCSETTPANIVEALFRFIEKETNCRKKQA